MGGGEQLKKPLTSIATVESMTNNNNYINMDGALLAVYFRGSSLLFSRIANTAKMNIFILCTSEISTITLICPAYSNSKQRSRFKTNSQS